MAEEIEQSAEELNQEQSSGKNSEEAVKETPTLEKLAEIVQGLQKGYTLTRQEFAEVKENIQSVADSLNEKSGAEQGTDEYVTVGKLKEVLAEHEQAKSQAQEARIKEADVQIEKTLSELEADGIVNSQKEKDDLLQFAVDNKILDLNKAAAKWIKEGSSEKNKELAKKGIRQEEGSKVGTSSKTTEEESSGINYGKMKDWMREQGL